MTWHFLRGTSPLKCEISENWKHLFLNRTNDLNVHFERSLSRLLQMNQTVLWKVCKVPRRLH